MKDLSYEMAKAYVGQMYTLLVEEDGQWYEEALAVELADSLGLSAKPKRPWCIGRGGLTVLAGSSSKKLDFAS